MYSRINAETRATIDWSFFANTEGCYIVKDCDNSLVVAYACNHEHPKQVDPNGKDLFIQYLEGSMKTFIALIDPYSMGYVLFQRNGGKDIKKYPFSRVARLVDKIV